MKSPHCARMHAHTHTSTGTWGTPSRGISGGLMSKKNSCGPVTGWGHISPLVLALLPPTSPCLHQEAPKTPSASAGHPTSAGHPICCPPPPQGPCAGTLTARSRQDSAGSDLAWLWPWCRPAAVAPIQPLAQQLLYATDAALKIKINKDAAGFSESARWSWEEVLPGHCHLSPPGGQAYGARPHLHCLIV